MAKKPKIKLYIGHTAFQEIEDEIKTSPMSSVYRKTIGHLETGLYRIELLVLKCISPLKRVPNIKDTIVRAGVLVINAHRDTGKSLAQALRTREFRVTLTVFCLLLISGVFLLQTGPVVSYAVELKQKVLGTADGGIENLAQAQALLENQQVGLAQNKFTQAYQSFSQSKQQLAEAGVLINGLANILPQKREGEQFLEAASLVSQAGIVLTEAYARIDRLKFSAAGITSEQADSESELQALESNLTSAKTFISKARALVEALDGSTLPESQKLRFAEAKEKILIAERALSATSDLVSILNALLLGDKHVLLILQNNNELRATGGFIGTYGAIDVSNGTIKSMDIRSIYDLDGQLAENIIPPHPLYAINDRWYMRDSNWFADFPQTAQKITSFYEKEGGESPDLIIGMTPNIITDLLTLVGPIHMGKYNVTLTSDNFVELTQVATSVTYDKALNQPKQLLADFVPELLGRLSSLEAKQYVRVMEIFQQNLNGKHILLYSRDPELEKRLDTYNWTGTLRKTDRDYLSIVSSNLGGTKTDLYLTQKANLESIVEADGAVKNVLTITKTNPLPNKEQYKNTSYIRIYVPKGAILESSLGFTFKTLEVPPYKGASEDDMVAEWEHKLLKNVTSGTVIGEEGGKTFFGNWLELSGGESKTVTLTYTLPFRLSKLDRHSLLLQKQAGANQFEFNYKLGHMHHNLVWKNSNPGLLDEDTLEQKITVTKDEFLGFVLSKD